MRWPGDGLQPGCQRIDLCGRQIREPGKVKRLQGLRQGPRRRPGYGTRRRRRCRLGCRELRRWCGALYAWQRGRRWGRRRSTPGTGPVRPQNDDQTDQTTDADDKVEHPASLHASKGLKV
jgi:hypothetical protein